MMRDIWKLFPRLLEDKINSLLETAEPNRMKAYQLYKSCQNESLWNESFGVFSQHLYDFFSLPKSERSKSRFDIFLNRPMHRSLFECFSLDFRTAAIDSGSVLKISGWAHNMMRINCNSSSPIISIDILTKTLNDIVNPQPFTKSQDIEFEDFCESWKKIIFNFFGKKYDSELHRLLGELHRLNIEQKNIEKTERFIPSIYLTQTEIDWTTSVEKAAEIYELTPQFPLSRGPQKQQLIELERISRLYRIVLNSEKSELKVQRENVRVTLIDRCRTLLRERAR